MRVICADGRDRRAFGRFDLLVLDGGGQGKAQSPPLDSGRWPHPGTVIEIDDLAPLTGWPPRFAGLADARGPTGRLPRLTVSGRTGRRRGLRVGPRRRPVHYDPGPTGN